MHVLISGSTSAALLVHMLAGCCWHHRHHSAVFGCPQVTVSDHHHTCHNHAEHGHESPAEDDSDERRGHPSDCDGPDCVFIVDAAPRVEVDSQSDFCGAPLISIVSRTLGRGAEHRGPAGRFVDHDVGRPVRTHLLLGHLLI